MFCKSSVLFSFVLLFLVGCTDSTPTKAEEVKTDVVKTSISKDAKTILIIGSGPAGLTAGIYSARAQFNTIVIDGSIPGGLLTTTPLIENWPGYENISGIELMDKIRKHAEGEGVVFVQDIVTKVDFSKTSYVVEVMSGKTFNPDAVIIATGAAHKHIGCLGEKEYSGKGVSYCATCDAPFFRNKDVVVVGGGNTALIEAHYLSRFAEHVTIVHTSPKFHVNDPIKDIVENTKNISIVHSAYVKEIKGDGNKVTGIEIENKFNKKRSEIKASGVFVAIGFNPNTSLFKDQIKLDKFGYVFSKIGSTASSVSGVFSGGDVSHFKYKQGIVAAGDGCRAALDAIHYLDTQR